MADPAAGPPNDPPGGGSGIGRSSPRRIARAFAEQMLSRVLGMVASMVTVALTVRHLSETSYGHLTTVIVFVSLWTSFTELGIGAVVVRRVTALTDEEQRPELEDLVRLNTGMSLLYCVPLAVLTVAAGLLVYRDEPEIPQILPIVAIGLVLTTISTCVSPVFLATVRFSAVAWSDLASRVLSLAVTAGLVAAGAGVVWFAVVQVVPPLVVLVVQGVAASRIVSWRPRFDVADARSLLVESLPQTAVLVIGVLYWRIDGVLLSVLDAPREVGVYYLASSIAFALSVVPTFFLSSTLSTYTALWTDDRDGFVAFARRCTETMLFVGLPVAAVGVVLAGPIVHLVGADSVAEHGPATLALLFVAVGVTFLNGSVSQALFASHQQHFLMRLNVATLGLNVVLNLVLIPLWGAIGAALALVVTELVGQLVASWRLNGTTHYRHPWRHTVHLLVATGAAALTAWVMHDLPVVASLTAAGIVYVVVNLLVGPVRLRDVRAMAGRGTA